MGFPRILPLIAISSFCGPAAFAHDLPALGNRASEEMLTIEQAARAPRSGLKARQDLFSVIAGEMKWKRSEIPVCFWNGDDALRRKIAGIADELTQGLSVRFAWDNFPTCPDAATAASGQWRRFPIRVSLKPVQGLMGIGDDASAFFSLVGTQSSFDRRTTLNLPSIDTKPEAEQRNRTLHEFCHALGCLHEHQRKDCSDLFNAPVIKQSFGLNDAQYEANFLRILDGGPFGPITASGFDKHSVMLYRLTPAMFLPGTTPACYRDPLASTLSDQDKAGLRTIYGGSTGAILRLGELLRRTEQYSEMAEQKRSRLNLFNLRLGGLLPNSKRYMALEERIAVLEKESGTADALAEAYRLDPEDKAAAEAALALFGRD